VIVDEACELLLTYPKMGFTEIPVPPKITLELRAKLWTWKILPEQVDGVVNKTRRRSSLWITRTTAERVYACSCV